MDSDALTNWYAVRVLLACTADDRAVGEFEDRLILVRAAAKDDARARGISFARTSEHQYTNADGEWVRWSFHKVIDVHPILARSLEDGVELYSAFVDSDTAAPLTSDRLSPLDAWQRENPGRDPRAATAGEILLAWERARTTTTWHCDPPG
jgi:hypothetical protein